MNSISVVYPSYTSGMDCALQAFDAQLDYLCSACADILRKMHSSEDTSIRDKVVNALFDEEIVAPKARQETFDTPKLREHDASIQYTELDTAVRDQVVEVTVEVFKQHCAKHMEILPMQLLGSSSQLERLPCSDFILLLLFDGESVSW